MSIVYENPAEPVVLGVEIKEQKIKEPSIIIKPIGRMGGLDNLHVTLAIVIVLLFLILLVISTSKAPVIITNGTNSTMNCTGCAKPIHTTTQIKSIVSRVLASYANVNGSISLLPFITNVSSANLNYSPITKSWYVYLNVKNIGSQTPIMLSFVVSDLNLSKITPLEQIAKPSQISNNSVVAQGTIQLVGKSACITKSPTNVYWFIDPYAPGAMSSLANATGLTSRYGTSRVNLTIKIVSGPATQNIASQAGLTNAQYLSKYTLCASQQQNFAAFVTNINKTFTGGFVSQQSLASIANTSRLNNTQLNLCFSNSTQNLAIQGLLASYYNITTTPLAVVNCQYEALPQTAQQALCYNNPQYC